MNYAIKASYIQRFLKGIGTGTGTVVSVLIGDKPITPEDSEHFHIIENEVIAKGLAINPGNVVIQGWKLLKLTNRGVELVDNNKLGEILYPDKFDEFNMYQLLVQLVSEGGEPEIASFAEDLSVDTFKLKKYAKVLEASEMVRIRKARYKGGEDWYLTVIDAGLYAVKNIENFREVLSNHTGKQYKPTIIIQNMGNSINIGNNNQFDGSQIGGEGNTNNPKGNDDPLTGRVQRRMSNIQLAALIVAAITAITGIILNWEDLFG